MKLNLIKAIEIALFLIFFSCRSSDNKAGYHLVKFDLKSLSSFSEVKLSDFGFVDVQYIPLETKGECLISGINDFYFPVEILSGDKFYIIKQYNKILKFNEDGSFVTSIGKEGRGPGEFTIAHDVNIDPKKQEIYVLSRWQKKFLVYSKTGELIKTFNISISPNQFNVVEDGILCYSENHLGNIEYSFDLLDFNGGVIKSYPNRFAFENHSSFGTENENIFYEYDHVLYSKEIYSDTIYKYEDKVFKPHLVIDVGKKTLTPLARSQNSAIDIMKHYNIPLKLFEFGGFVYYEFTSEMFGGIKECSYISSEKNEPHAVLYDSRFGIVNDLDGGPNILPKTIKDDSTIVAIVEATKLKAHIASELFYRSEPKFPAKKKNLKNMVDNIKETDNPILMIVRLKN